MNYYLLISYLIYHNNINLHFVIIVVNEQYKKIDSFAYITILPSITKNYDENILK